MEKVCILQTILPPTGLIRTKFILKWVVKRLDLAIKVIVITSNFWCLANYVFDPGKKQTIKFRGAIPIEMNFRQYIYLGSIMVRGYHFSKTPSDFKNDLWTVYLQNNHRLIGDDQMISSIGGAYIETGINDFDYRGKRVLDIGGYIGDTLVLFSSRGASHVLIYEPVPQYVTWIQKNVRINNIDAEIYTKGIGKKDGQKEIYYNSLDNSTGTELGKGKYKMVIEIQNATDVIKNSHADIAKINCEGAEKYLISVSNDVLRLIPEWVIHAHSTQLRQSVLDKFINAGFKIKNDYVIADGFSITVFYL